ncbi:MAG: response regulator, partial [Gemmatimonadetes bacterium]|nr:response regulator [Gemmatimonadota bacterium]
MPRILVIEDNADLAFGLRNNLEIEGHEVDLAGNGAEAFEMAARAAPDLVILDLMLPGMDGYELLRRLRQDGDALPILVLTARSEEADRILAFRLGADDYV